MSGMEGQTEEVPCGVCSSERFEVLLPSKRDPARPVELETVFRSSGDEPLQDQLVRCRDCGLVYVRPRLRWELILEGYRGGTDEGFLSQIAFRERTFRRCLDRIERMAPPPGRRVLDVGAAGGSFLAMARERGYAVSGCEPSTWMCGFARDHYGLELQPGTLLEMPTEPASLDLLTLWDVLEHTPDPRAVLDRAHALLAPGGTLAITVPDYGSWAARLLGSRWPFLLTVHLWYFERRTIADLLRRAGFEPLGYRPHLQTLELGYVGKRAAPYLGPPGRLGAWLLEVTRVGRLPIVYWVGQTLIVARRKDTA
jgi:SAM-dependent methyltransferase